MNKVTMAVLFLAVSATGCGACEEFLDRQIPKDGGVLADAGVGGRPDAAVRAEPEKASQPKAVKMVETKQHIERPLARFETSTEAYKTLDRAKILQWLRRRSLREEKHLIVRALDFHDEFAHAGMRVSVPPVLLAAIAMKETGCGQFLLGPNVKSSKGVRNARGIMQVLDPSKQMVDIATARIGCGVLDWKNNHYHNITLGGVIFSEYVADQSGSVPFGLAAYHGGPNAPRMKVLRHTTSFSEFETIVAFEPCWKYETQAQCDARKLDIIKYVTETLGHAFVLRVAVPRFGDLSMTKAEIQEIRRKLKLPTPDNLTALDFPGIDTEKESGIARIPELPAPVTVPDDGTVGYRRNGRELERVAQLFRTDVDKLPSFNEGMRVSQLAKESEIIVPGRKFRLVYDVSELARLLYPGMPELEALKMFFDLNGTALQYGSAVYRPIVPDSEMERLEARTKKRVDAALKDASERLLEEKQKMQKATRQLVAKTEAATTASKK